MLKVSGHDQVEKDIKRLEHDLLTMEGQVSKVRIEREDRNPVETGRDSPTFDLIVRKEGEEMKTETRVNERQLECLPKGALEKCRDRKKYFYMDYGEKLMMFEEVDREMDRTAQYTMQEMVENYMPLDEDLDLLPYAQRVKILAQYEKHKL